MYLLYLDESGNPGDASDQFFVLAGAAVFERVTYFVSQELEKVQTAHFPGQQPIEFHAAKIRAGTGFWRRVPEHTRVAVVADLERVVRESNRRGLVLFAAAVEKNREIHGEEAVRVATEQVCKRFDTFLARRFHEDSDPQRSSL